MDSTDLTNLDAAITAAIGAGATTVAEVRDAIGNSIRYPDLSKLIEGRIKLAGIANGKSRRSVFDKVQFASKFPTQDY
jgi:hypothetical protein